MRQAQPASRRSPCVVQQVALGAGPDARGVHPLEQVGHPAHLAVDPQRRPRGRPRSHGTRTKARSWARGWGRVSVASSICTSVLKAGSPYWTRSRSRVRAPQRVSRVRPCACSTSCRQRSSARGASVGRARHHRVEVCRLVRSADGVGLDDRGDRVDVDQRRAARRTACVQGLDATRPRLEPSARTTGVSRSRAHAHLHVGERVAHRRLRACAPRPRRPRPGVGAADVGDALRQRLDQVERLALDQGDDVGGDLGVVRPCRRGRRWRPRARGRRP